MKAAQAILISSLGVLLGWIGKVATMDRLDAEEFRLIKDGKVLWSVAPAPTGGGALMTFFVDGKPMIEMGADSNASAMNIKASGASGQCNLVVKGDVASWGMMSGAAQFVDKVKSEDGAWTVVRQAQVGEHSVWFKAAEMEIGGFSRGGEVGVQSGKHPFVVRVADDGMEAHGVGGHGAWTASATKQGRLALEVEIAEKVKSLWEYFLR